MRFVSRASLVVATSIATTAVLTPAANAVTVSPKDDQCVITVNKDEASILEIEGTELVVEKSEIDDFKDSYAEELESRTAELQDAKDRFKAALEVGNRVDAYAANLDMIAIEDTPKTINRVFTGLDNCAEGKSYDSDSRAAVRAEKDAMTPMDNVLERNRLSYQVEPTIMKETLPLRTKTLLLDFGMMAAGILTVIGVLGSIVIKLLPPEIQKMLP